MAVPPLFEQDTNEEDLTVPLKSKLADLKASGQKISQKINEGMVDPVMTQPSGVPQGPQMKLPPLAQPQGPQKQPQQPQQKQQDKPAPRAQPVTVGDITDQQSAVTTGPATSPITGGVTDISGLPKLRGLAYGPNSEGATKADQSQVKGAWDQPLQPGDIAVSPTLLSRYPLRSYVNVVDSKGQVVLANQHVADVSMINSTTPTTNTFELWNGRSLGSGYYLVPVPAPATPAAGALPAEFAAPTASFAQGGIVRQPTVALVGEKGPEAIVPLSRDLGGSFKGISSLGSRGEGSSGTKQKGAKSPLQRLSDDMGSITDWLGSALS